MPESKALERVFAPLHRMMESLNAVEPTVHLAIIAYDQNDPGPHREGLVISNIKMPEELVKLLRDAIDGANMRRILFRTPRS
jgi:hypothetical protein